ncbi:MAG TPA: trigger factor [Bacillota bacterium]|jgi:trigger factor
MKVTLEKLDKNKVKLDVMVDEEAVAKAYDRAYKAVAGRVSIPGFRRGKAPRRMVERKVGADYLKEEALDRLLQDSYAGAVDEAKVDPIDRPEVDVVEFEEGKPLRFTASVEVKPEVALGQYKGLDIELEKPDIKDEDVAHELESLQLRQSQLAAIPADQPAEKGSFVVLDFEGFIDGQPFQGGKAEGQLVELGSGTFIPGFEEGVVGAKAGEEREVKVTFPADYRATELAGKEATFKIRVREVKKRELPALDDEFAKGLGAKSLDDMKESIRKRLELVAQSEARRKFNEAVIERVADNATVEVPDVMFNRRVDQMVHDLEHRLEDQKMTMDQYLQYTNQTADALREQFRPAAVRGVKNDLVLEAVGKAENLLADDSDVNLEIARLAQLYGRSPDEIRKVFAGPDRVDALKESITLQKAVRFLTRVEPEVAAVESAPAVPPAE